MCWMKLHFGTCFRDTVKLPGDAVWRSYGCMKESVASPAKRNGGNSVVLHVSACLICLPHAGPVSAYRGYGHATHKEFSNIRKSWSIATYATVGQHQWTRQGFLFFPDHIINLRVGTASLARIWTWQLQISWMATKFFFSPEGHRCIVA